MPNELLIKLGLVENGSGHLRCPHLRCGSERLKLVMVTYGTDQATTVVAPGMTKVTWEGPLERRDNQYLDVVWQCHNGHQFGIELTYRPGEDDVTTGTADYRTTWEAGDGRDD